MPEASVFLGPLQSLLAWFQKQRHVDDERKDAALHAMHKALLRTQQYIEESGGVKCADRNREYELAQLWADAATKARHASGELAGRLNDKSTYWADQIEWSPDEVLSKRIDLASVQREIASMLKKC